MTTNQNNPADSSDHPSLPVPPMLARIGTLIAGAILALSTLPWAYYSLNHFGGFAWGFFGFEIISLLASVFAILLGLGKFKDGWALGVTSIAGALTVALVFGLYADFIMARRTDYPDLYPLAKNTLLARAILIVALFSFASLAVFVRNKTSFALLFKSILSITPVAIVAFLMKQNLGPGAWLNSKLATSSGSGATQAILTLVLGLFAIILISASGHLLIRAYELGRTDPQPSSE